MYCLLFDTGVVALFRSMLLFFATATLVMLTQTFTHAHSILPGPIAARYSADDSVCGTLDDLFTKLHRRYPKARYTSEVRSALFSHTGVSPPPWIDHSAANVDAFYNADAADRQAPRDAVRSFLETGMDNLTSNGFFETSIKGDDERQLVHVRQDAFGSRGDYETTVWLLKPNAPYRVRTDVAPKGTLDPFVDPTIVSKVVSFATHVEAFRPTFPASPNASEDDKRLLRFVVGEMPQEPIKFKERVYFVAGQALDGVRIVYRFTPDGNATVTCLSAPDFILRYEKSHPN